MRKIGSTMVIPMTTIASAITQRIRSPRLLMDGCLLLMKDMAISMKLANATKTPVILSQCATATL